MEKAVVAVLWAAVEMAMEAEATATAVAAQETAAEGHLVASARVERAAADWAPVGRGAATEMAKEAMAMEVEAGTMGRAEEATAAL